MKKLLLTTCFVSSLAFAFPEMVRHGYTNCTTCHVSPNGGGVLTAYGRSLAKEALSTWGTENETKFLYGAISSPEWLSLGGDVRALQLHQDTPVAVSGRFIFMQFDVEAAAKIEKWTIAATLGLDRPPSSGPKTFSDYLTSRRFYASYQLNDKFSVRAGRFFPAYGLNVPDHFLVTRKGLGWDFGGESHNIEAAWLGETTDIFATVMLGRLDVAGNPKEKGFALRSSLTLGDTHKVGANYLYGSNPTQQRHLAGVFGVLGFSKKLFLLAEFNLQHRLTKSSGNESTGLTGYARLNYEWLQGLHTYLSHQISKASLSVNDTFESYGVGMQFFPRPHWELRASWNKQRDASIQTTFDDFAWLLFHFYL